MGYESTGWVLYWCWYSGEIFVDAGLNMNQQCVLMENNTNHRLHFFSKAVACSVGLWLSSFWQWDCNGNSSRTPVEEKQKLEGITWKNSKIFKNLQCISDGDVIREQGFARLTGERLQGDLTVAYIYLKSFYSNDGSKLFPIVSGKRQ